MVARMIDVTEIARGAPVRGGLLSVATVHDGSNEFVLNKGYVSSLPCAIPVQAPYDCWATEPVANANKTTAGISEGTIYTFSLYAGVQCFLQADESEFARRATEALLGGETAGVEKALYEVLVDLVPASPIPGQTGIVEAIGAGERWAGQNLGVLPIFHMDRFLTTEAISRRVAFPGLDWSITTGQGSPIDNAGGFPNGTQIWVTGPVHVWRGPVKTYRAVHPTQNRELVLAERTYGLVVECGGASVNITT